MTQKREVEFNLERILVDDDEFAPTTAKDKPILRPHYFRNNLTSNGGLLSPEEREIASEIFDPNDSAFLEVVRSAFE